MNIAGLASTDLREGLLIRDDVKTEDVDTGVASFGFTVPYSAGEHADVKKIIREGNYNVYEINETLFAFDQSLLGA